MLATISVAAEEPSFLMCLRHGLFLFGLNWQFSHRERKDSSRVLGNLKVEQAIRQMVSTVKSLLPSQLFVRVSVDCDDERLTFWWLLLAFIFCCV